MHNEELTVTCVQVPIHQPHPPARVLEYLSLSCNWGENQFKAGEAVKLNVYIFILGLHSAYMDQQGCWVFLVPPVTSPLMAQS